MAITLPDRQSRRALEKAVSDDSLLTDAEWQTGLVKTLQNRWTRGGREALNEFLKVTAQDPNRVISPRVLLKLSELTTYGIDTPLVSQIQTRQAKAIEVFNTLVGVTKGDGNLSAAEWQAVAPGIMSNFGTGGLAGLVLYLKAVKNAGRQYRVEESIKRLLTQRLANRYVHQSLISALRTFPTPPPEEAEIEKILREAEALLPKAHLSPSDFTKTLAKYRQVREGYGNLILKTDDPNIAGIALEQIIYVDGQILKLLTTAKTADYPQVKTGVLLGEIDSELASLNPKIYPKAGYYKARLQMLLFANDARNEKYDEAMALLRDFIRKAGQKIEQAEARFYRAEAGFQKALLLDTGRQRTKYLDDAKADFEKSTDRDLLGDLQPYWYNEVPKKLQAVSDARSVEQKIDVPPPATAEQFQGAKDLELPTTGASTTPAETPAPPVGRGNTTPPLEGDKQVTFNRLVLSSLRACRMAVLNETRSGRDDSTSINFVFDLLADGSTANVAIESGSKATTFAKTRCRNALASAKIQLGVAVSNARYTLGF